MKKTIFVDNRIFIQAIKTTAALLELYGENDFKIRSYQNAVFSLEKYSGDLSSADAPELAKIKGVGKSLAENILEIQQTGTFALYEELLEKTPSGILDILNVKGLGAKKVKVLWKELGIETKQQLLEAIEKDKLIDLKGFGKKTQEKIFDTLKKELENKGKLLYAQAETFCHELQELLSKQLPDVELLITGQVRRKLEVIEEIRFICNEEVKEKLKEFILKNDILDELPDSSPINWRARTKSSEVTVIFSFYPLALLHQQLFLTSATPEHLSYKIEDLTLRKLASEKMWDSEKLIYQQANLPFYIPELREGRFEFELNEKELNDVISARDLKGILHNHTTYSDGKNTLREMAEHCIEMGCEYLGINDHSKSAYFYANGMYEEQVYKQQEEIDQLNEELAPFKIFKGIEVDILQDGSLDYAMEVMETFDFTVASIHSAFNMDIKKATERIVTAINHPYTTMLGHMTGRLLLRREGYPLDYDIIIEECAKNEVILELNANPWRLDIDWRFIRKALDKGVMISINPDAHSKEGLHDIYYGVCAARKAALPKSMTFNAKSKEEVMSFFQKRKEKAITL